MAKRRPAGARNEMIHCEYCGEDYAATYKRCPFCDGRPPEEGAEGEEGRHGGKRLVTNTRGGGYGGGGHSPLKIVGTVISLALIVAAVCIVFTLIMPLVGRGNTDTIDPDAVTPTPVTEPSQAPSSEDPAVSASPSATVPADQTATGFTLDQSEFSFSDSYPNPVQINVTFIPSGSTGTITWTSADPEVATVDENGLVSPGTRRGNTTITASMPGAADQTCIVRNGITSASSSGSGTGTGTNTGTGTLSLNHTDFSFGSTSDPTVQMRVSGTTSTPTWSIGDTSVATISSSGVVTPVGSGTTTITCTVDGQTLTCIVRCQF